MAAPFCIIIKLILLVSVNVGEVRVVNVGTAVVLRIACSGVSAHVGCALLGIALGSCLLIKLSRNLVEALLQVVLGSVHKADIVLCDSVLKSGSLCIDRVLVFVSELVAVFVYKLLCLICEVLGFVLSVNLFTALFVLCGLLLSVLNSLVDIFLAHVC